MLSYFTVNKIRPIRITYNNDILIDSKPLKQKHSLHNPSLVFFILQTFPNYQPAHTALLTCAQPANT